ncbi:MAG: helix-turn-helix domain-containing protein [Nannocystaceae bacterium]
MRLVIDTYNLTDVERMLCVEALNAAGTIVDAAALLGITRHALKRRIIKHEIAWPPRPRAVIATPEPERSASPFPGSNSGGFRAD